MSITRTPPKINLRPLINQLRAKGQASTGECFQSIQEALDTIGILLNSLTTSSNDLETTLDDLDATPPANCTPGSASYRYDEEGWLEITIQRTPPSPLGTYKGDHAYLEIPDQSDALTAPMDGTISMDGTASFGGEWSPLDCGQFPSGGPVIIRFLSPLTRQMTIRWYLQPYSNVVDEPPTRAVSGASTTPTGTLVVNPPVAIASGEEYCQNVTAFTKSAVTQDSSTGKSLSSFTVSCTPPSDPAWAGVVYVAEDSAGDFVDWAESPTGASLLIERDTPSEIVEYWLWAVSFNGEGERNSIIAGVTPRVLVTLGTTAGTIDATKLMPLTFDGAEFEVSPSTGKFQIKGVDFSKAQAGTFNGTDFEVTGGSFTVKGVDLLKAINFSSTEFEKSGGVFLVKGLAADKLKTGILEVGGAAVGGTRVSIAKFYTTANPPVLYGWIGDDSGGSGYVGAWFQRMLIGGSSPATAPFFADSSGNVVANGILITSAGTPLGWIGSSGGDQGAWFQQARMGGASFATANIQASSGGVTISNATFTLTNGTLTCDINGTDGFKMTEDVVIVQIAKDVDSYGTHGILIMDASDNDTRTRIGTEKIVIAGGAVLGAPWIILDASANPGIVDVSRYYSGADHNVRMTPEGMEKDGSACASGSFTTVDSKTVTVEGGLIVSIV